MVKTPLVSGGFNQGRTASVGGIGVEKLSNLRYLNGRLDIIISRKGSKLAAVKVNGKTQSVKKPIAPADGITQIELILK